MINNVNEKVERIWGSYQTLFMNKATQTKIIDVEPSKALSLQEHMQREEVWIVVDGTADVIVGESKLRLEKGQTVFIPKKCKHQLINPNDDRMLQIIEVQLGDYFGEDDIIRY